MTKQFEWFCRERTIRGTTTDTDVIEEDFAYPSNRDDVNVNYYVCVRLDNKLIGTNDLFKGLGLEPERDIIAKRTKVEVDKFRNFKDAANFGLFAEVQFSIIPVDPQRTKEPYGDRYSSYVAYNASKPFDEIKTTLLEDVFQ